MDEVIFEEFKGTGNMEVVLSRESQTIAFSRPWISPKAPRANRNCCLEPEELRQITMLRRSFEAVCPVEAADALVKKLQQSPTNKELLSAFS